jgi:hypothetical protein
MPAAQPMPSAGNVGAEGHNNKRAAGAKVKEEHPIPKKVKEVNWAPPGYHLVKSVGILASVIGENSAESFTLQHFRKNPKRKQKTAAQPALDNGPASYEIVQVE